MMCKDNENDKPRDSWRMTAENARKVRAARVPTVSHGPPIEPPRREIEEIPDWVMSGG